MEPLRSARLPTIGAAFTVVVLAAACGSSDPVSVERAWARATPAVQANGAVYFELTVDSDDLLVGASVPPSVAAAAQLHAVVDTDAADHDHDDGHDHHDHHGDQAAPAVSMRELTDGLDLSAGATVAFAPGSYHVMLVDLAEPLESGDEIELTLDLLEHGPFTLTVPVEESAP